MKTRLISILSLVVGAILFIFLIRHSGTAQIYRRVVSLGYGFVLILGISMIRQFARTWAWLRCMNDDDRDIGFFGVWSARLAGDALSDLTAAGPVIGEPVKLAAVNNGKGMGRLAQSLAVENIAYALSCFVFIAIGALTLLTMFALEASVRTAGVTILCGSALALLALVAALRSRWRVISTVGNWVIRVLNLSPTKRQRLVDVETFVFDFFRLKQADFWVVAFCEGIFHCAGVLEIWVVLYLIGSPASLVSAFVLESVNRAINLIFAFVPALVGVDEAGTGLLTNVIGLGTATGVTLAIIRKGRMFVWIAVGLAFLARRRRQ